MLYELARLKKAESRRVSSWDTSGRNADFRPVPAGESAVLADIKGPGCINHIWMAQSCHYRECLIKITWDNVLKPSILCPMGDFFGLGHGIVNSYQSFLFSASTKSNNQFNQGCALNCYAQMPFRERALIELINESPDDHRQYFYIDYETCENIPDDACYFHAEFRRENPFGGWGHEIQVNSKESDIANKERLAWENNYVILETGGCGHYVGCNISVTNFKGDWWGEGDDMIWVDGYKWPPDLHGTGSEDYFNQAWGMQDNAFMRNGSSVFEGNTICRQTDAAAKLNPWNIGAYQTSYVHHIENPVRFRKEIKVTIEHGHGNHLCNEMSSTAYWYADKPSAAKEVPPVGKRMPVLRDNSGRWLYNSANQFSSGKIKLNEEMKAMKKKFREKINSPQ